MSLVLPDRIFVAKHYVTPALVTSITTINIGSFEPGHGKDNLMWEDPWLSMQTLTTSTAPIIQTKFASATAINCVGLVNHKGLAGTIMIAEYWDSAAWIPNGTFGISANDNDSDVLIAVDPFTSTDFRIRFIGDIPDEVQIGTLFWGSGIELSQNPDAGVSPMVQDLQVYTEEAAGGARQTIIGADKVSMSQQLVWSRMPWADLELMRGLPRGEMIGIIPAEQAAAGNAAFGTPHVFGYIKRIQSALQTGEGIIDYRYDAAIDIVGAV